MKGKKKWILWAILLVLVLCIAFYWIANPGEASQMAGGKADAVIGSFQKYM